ncbi:MAG: lamin tail domain-containing protein [Planctomycetes bacterium]|nr:lamin tail domain-containing protein [Planctomycetota bacterium]
MKTQQWLLTIVFAGMLVTDARAQVAITEFLNNPDGADQGREWLELYNFGPVDLCLAGWTVADEGIDLFTLPEATIVTGGYVVLVSGGVPGFGGVDAATAKAIFETEWLGGRESPAVIGMQGLVLANAADEIVLRDSGGAVIWSLAWSDDETSPFATFLTETTLYAVRVFGSSEEPGVVRNGDDNGVPGFAGYEQNDVAADSFARASTIELLVALFGEDFANVLVPSVASPLAGGYQPVPVGDLDGDTVVGIQDFLLLLAAWGTCGTPCAACPADLDGDDIVGSNDFLALLAGWG